MPDYYTDLFILLIFRVQDKSSKKAKLNKPVDDVNPSERSNNNQNFLTQLLKILLMIRHLKTMKSPQTVWMLSRPSLSRQARLSLLRKKVTM